MHNYGYLVYQAERTKTQAEQRETDAQLGQLSAAFAQLLRPLAKPARLASPARYGPAGSATVPNPCGIALGVDLAGACADAGIGRR